MTLSELARRDPRLLVLRCVEELQTSLERNNQNVPTDDWFHVRVRGRIVFSGPYAAAQARYVRAVDAQLWRRLSEARHQARPPNELQRTTGGRHRPAARRPNGRYAGQRRISWRMLVPARPSAPRNDSTLTEI
jgi:hypothetical protein